MTKQSATRSSPPSDHKYNDGLNLPSNPELDGRIAEAFAASPQPDAGRMQEMVRSILARLKDETPDA